MVDSLRNTKKKGLKSFIDGLSGWRRGAFVGFLIGFGLFAFSVFFSIVMAISGKGNGIDHLIGLVLFVFLIVVFPMSVVGFLAGILESKSKNKYLSKASKVGLVWGGVGAFINIMFPLFGVLILQWIAKPINYIYSSITGCGECEGVIVIFAFLNVIVFFLFGTFVGFVTNILRGNKI